MQLKPYNAKWLWTTPTPHGGVHVHDNGFWYNHFRKLVVSSKAGHTNISYNLAISNLGTPQRYAYGSIISKNKKLGKPKCPSIGEWINWYNGVSHSNKVKRL